MQQYYGKDISTKSNIYQNVTDMIIVMNPSRNSEIEYKEAKESTEAEEATSPAKQHDVDIMTSQI